MCIPSLCMGAYGILRRCTDWVGTAEHCTRLCSNGQVCNARFLWLFSRFEKAKCASGFCRVPGVLALARHYSTGPSEKQSFKGIDVAATNIVPMSVSIFFKTAAGAEKFQDHAADDAIGRHWHLVPPSTAARWRHLTQVPTQVRRWSLEGRWADAGGALSTAGIRQGTDDGDCCLDAQLQRSAAGGSCESSCVK